MTILNINREVEIIDSLKQAGFFFRYKRYDFEKNARIMIFENKLMKLKLEVRLSYLEEE